MGKELECGISGNQCQRSQVVVALMFGMDDVVGAAVFCSVIKCHVAFVVEVMEKAFEDWYASIQWQGYI